MGKFSVQHRHVMHQINRPEKEESNSVVKSLKSHVCFLHNGIFQTSKMYSSQKGARGGRIVIWCKFHYGLKSAIIYSYM